MASEGQVPVGCTVGSGAIRSCTVEVYIGGKLVGTGTANYGKAGTTSGRVKVKLSAAVRSQLAGKSVKASFVFRATPVGGGKALTSRKKVTLAPRASWILPSDGLFESGRARLMPKVRRYLKTVAPGIRSARTIRVVGHTDSLGTSADNHALGLRRAQQVVRELRRLGVRSNLVARSAGEARPRATNDTLQGRWSNRRVELRILR